MHQRREGRRDMPRFPPMIYHNRHDGRQPFALFQLLFHLLHDAHLVAQQLERDPLIRIAFVLDQHIDVRP